MMKVTDVTGLKATISPFSRRVSPVLTITQSHRVSSLIVFTSEKKNCSLFKLVLSKFLLTWWLSFRCFHPPLLWVVRHHTLTASHCPPLPLPHSSAVLWPPIAQCWPPSDWVPATVGTVTGRTDGIANRGGKVIPAVFLQAAFNTIKGGPRLTEKWPCEQIHAIIKLWLYVQTVILQSFSIFLCREQQQVKGQPSLGICSFLHTCNTSHCRLVHA